MLKTIFQGQLSSKIIYNCALLTLIEAYSKCMLEFKAKVAMSLI